LAYSHFLRAQRQALLDEWLGLGASPGINVAYIAVPDLSWLDRLADPRQPGGGGGWSPLPGVSPTDALTRRDLRGRPQLWVRPEEKAEGDGRYARYWRSFARLHGEPVAGGPSGGGRLAVDHLFPETAAARRGFALVRVMPVDLRSNSLVGSTVEAVEARRGGALRARTASSITLAKVTGFQGSFARSHAAADIAAALLAHIRGCGLVVPQDFATHAVAELQNMTHLIGFFRR
jgi:hypothetical protein